MKQILTFLCILALAAAAPGQTTIKTPAEYTTATTIAAGDLLLMWDIDAVGSAKMRSITFANLTAGLQPLDADLTTFAGITPSANVQTLLAAANYAAIKTSLSLGNVENTALSTWAGSTNITTLGTISSGTWNASVIGPTYLGTGTSISTKYLRGDGTWQTISGGGDALTSGNLSQFAATTSAQFATVLSDEEGSSGGFVRKSVTDALQPLDADLTALAGISGVAGDVIYHNGTSWTRLAKGANGDQLTLASGVPSWATPQEWSLADPGADAIIGWDDSSTGTEVKTWTLGTGLAESGGSIVLDADLQTWAGVTPGSGVATFLATPTATNFDAAVAIPDVWMVAISDETTAITTGTAKITFRAPYAATVTGVRAGLTTVSSSGIPTFDINEAGTTILSTKLTVDASEKTSVTAATAAVISDTAIADDAEITIDIDTAGTGAAGAKVFIYVTR